MLRAFHGFALLSLGVAAACATVPAITGDPAVTVTAPLKPVTRLASLSVASVATALSRTVVL